jgi:formylglycine-generating enzyme required for sulfatase activity/serine/threonine protein kinase
MFRPGDRIGPYILLRKIGRGAFGVVWLAERRTAIVNMQVAVKLALNEDIDLEAVKQEAGVWVHASGHPNILPIIEADVYDDHVVIVSEYAPDGSLDDWLKRHEGNAPSIEQSIEMASGILAGLEHLHARRIIHRDLKPPNILLQGETPRLADFGIARVLKSTAQSAIVAGTPAYMAPEAFDGKRNERTDVWSAGVILYQLVADVLPFPQRDITSLIGAITRHDPDPLPTFVPDSLQQVIARALEKNPAQRYMSAAEMQRALRDAGRYISDSSARATVIEATALFGSPGTQSALRQEEDIPPKPEPKKTPFSELQGTATPGSKPTDGQRSVIDLSPALPSPPLARPTEPMPPQPSGSEHIQAGPALALGKEVQAEALRAKRGAPLQWYGIGGAITLVVAMLLVAVWIPSLKRAQSPDSMPAAAIDVASLPRLRTYEFNVVTLDEKGNVTERRQGQSRDFAEDLGGSVTLDMVEITGGTFVMGSPKSEANRFNDEGPQHQVSLLSFYLGKFEVTQAQWRVVANLPKVDRGLNPDPSRFKGDNRPVENVSWEDATEFCARLSSKTGRTYRLPSEAEWEYACRAGTTTPFAFGQTITPEFVNYDGNYPYGSASKGTYRVQTTSVGGLGVANAFGLYDMQGNVMEWCADPWHESYSGAPTDGSVFQGGDAGRRVLRGGSWYSLAYGCRSANRTRISPDYRNDTVGFRVVMAARTP